jgi:protease PrsW
MREAANRVEVWSIACGGTYDVAATPGHLSPMTCPRCGALLPSGAKFCNQCGTAVTAGRSAPSAVSVTASAAPQASASPGSLPTAAAPLTVTPQMVSTSAAATVLHHYGPAQRSLHYLALAMLGVLMLFLSGIVLGILREQSHTFPAFAISVVMAVLPVPIYATLIVVLDRHQRGPGWLLFGAFFWGAVVAVLIAIEANTGIQRVLTDVLGRQWANLLTPSLVAPFVEETSKGLALLFIFWFMRFELNDVVDGIVYGALVGLGFAMTENVLYFSRAYHAGGLEAASINFYFRAILGGFGHALYTASTGAGLGLAEETDNQAVRWIAPVAGYCAAMFLHFLWNTVVSVQFPPASDLVELLIIGPFMTAILTFPGILTLLFITIFAWRRETRVISEQLRDEVERGIIRPGEYALLSDDGRRATQVWRTLFHYGPLAWFMVRQFYNLEMGLAFRKWHTARGERLPARAQGQSEDAYREHIAALRTRLNSMGVPVE